MVIIHPLIWRPAELNDLARVYLDFLSPGGGELEHIKRKLFIRRIVEIRATYNHCHD